MENWSIKMKNLLTKLTQSLISYHPEVINYDEFRHSAIFLPLIDIEGKSSLLFEKRTLNIPQGGEICFPGGRVEVNEAHNPLMTAIRETSEELGISVDKIKIISRLPRLITPDGKLIDAFIGNIEKVTFSELAINLAEVERVFAIPLAQLKTLNFQHYQINSTNYSGDSSSDPLLLPVEKLGLPQRYQGEWGKKNYSVFYTEWQNEKIWGLTARYLKYIKDLL